MCALASLAEFPALVRSIFYVPGGSSPRQNDAGVYQVRWCEDARGFYRSPETYARRSPNSFPTASSLHVACRRCASASTASGEKCAWMTNFLAFLAVVSEVAP